MAVLEQINQMRQQGLQDNEIVGRLQEQGVSPKAINDAFNQESIKNAVGSGGDEEPDIPSPSGGQPQQKPGSYRTQEVDEDYAPQEGYSSQEQYYSPPQSQQGYGYPQQGGYEGYDQYYDYGQGGYGGGYGYSQGGTSTDTIIEISEQVVSEKMHKIQKQINEFSEFRKLTESRVENFSERLKRIEDMIDKMQSAILEKVGDYGRNIENMKNEMSMMQDSFGKVVPELARKNAGKHKATHSKKQSSKKKSTKKKRSK